MIVEGKRSNLALEHTSFVGRDAALAELVRVLDHRRPITLIGAAGVGKTRTAKELVGSLESEVDLDAIAFVDLSAAPDPDHVQRAIAAAFDLELAQGVELASMIDQLGETVLILDDFEHLLGHAGAMVAELADRCPRARLVLTSREPLGLDGEKVYRLEPLRAGEAMALFESRARMIQHDFAVHAGNRAVIEAIVEQLGRLPFAIELAAARVGLLSLDAMLERLGSRSADEGAIEWSWQLLAPWERSALAQISLFRGGFDLAAAEQILDLSDHPIAPKLIDVIQSLKTKGLLRSYSPAPFPNEVRFDLYESVRRFAWELMAASGFADHAARQHARRYLAVVRSWLDQIDSSREARARVDLEIDNLLIAQRRTEVAAPGLSVHVALTLDRALPGRAPYGLRRSVLDRAIAAAQTVFEPELLAKAMLARGNFERLLAPTEAALGDLWLAERAAIECGARVLEGEAVFARAKVAADRGELEAATDGYRRALEIFARERARRQEGEVFGCLANVYLYRGRLDEAEALFDGALEVHRSTNNLRAEGITLSNLAALCEERGRLELARGHYRRAQEIHRQIGNRRSEGIVLANLGNLHRREARFEDARSAYQEALAIHREVHNRRSEAIVLGCVGALAIEEGRLSAARVSLELAVELAVRVGAARSAAVDRMRLAIVDHLEGDLARAESGLLRAVADLDQIGDARNAALARGHLGAVLAERGAMAEAEQAIESARTTLLALSDVQLAAAVEVLGAVLEVVRLALGSLGRLLEVERSVPAAEARIAEIVLRRVLERARARIAEGAATSP